VLPTGPDGNGDTFLQDAKADGARIDLINVMTMDYGASFDSPSPNMGNFAVQAAQDTLNFAKTVWPSDTFANIGITPMIGQNDDAAEVFTEADAHTVVNFANANGIGRLAFWSVDRDQPCGGTANGLPSCSEIAQSALDFTKIFTGFTGTGGGTVPPPPPPTTTAPSPPPTSTAPPPPTGLIANGGFESGALSPWTCDAGTASVVSTPVHTGTHALAAAATNSDDAQCTETVAVQPSHTYTLSAWVQGNFAFLGATGTGTSDPSTFTQSAPTYTQLTTTFTTGSTTTSVTVFVHGWFAQGTVHIDDVTLS
jgi:chitinase